MATIHDLEIQKRELKIKKLEAEIKLLNLKSDHMATLAQPVWLVEKDSNKRKRLGWLISIGVAAAGWAIIFYCI